MTSSMTVGIVGGGQLGRMLLQSASRLGIRGVILDPMGRESSAGQLTNLSVSGSYAPSINEKERNQVLNNMRELATICDVVTVEIEHVDTTALAQLEKDEMIVYPSSDAISLIQDKFTQKINFAGREWQGMSELDLSGKVIESSIDGIAMPSFALVSSEEDVLSAVFGSNSSTPMGFPVMLKRRKLAYDGRGNAVVRNVSELSSAFNSLGSNDLYVESWVPYELELAVMVVRGRGGETLCFPVVETIQRNSICHAVVAPARISPLAQRRALDLAKATVDALPYGSVGVFGVEMFLLSDDAVLLNEVAPRPHNSGHYTIDACPLSQYEAHLRAIFGLPFPEFPNGQVPLTSPVSVMVNILGDGDDTSTRERALKALKLPGAHLHWYDKGACRLGRKVAHITLVGNSLTALRSSLAVLDVEDAVYTSSLQSISSSGFHGSRGKTDGPPRVGIIMGSDSDLPSMIDAANVLDEFNVPFELSIVSAHRTPSLMYTYAQGAAERGINVIIAGAGGAAHLPGMVAALTSLPVIGVPILSSAMRGQDSLLSIVQMPKGVPVATVAIGNSKNAGLLAIRMLGMSDLNLRDSMEHFLITQEDEVLDKRNSLHTLGHEEYLRRMSSK